MKVNGYNLTRAWFDWRFENPDKGSFKHAEIYFFIIDLWNRLGQKDKIGLPVNNLKEALSIGNRNTIYTALRDLEEWGFIKTISEAKNQNQSRIISLTACTLYEQPGEQALDQAHEQASEQPGEHINKQLKKGTTKKETTDTNSNNEIIKEVVNFYHQKCTDLSKVVSLTDKRKSAIKARIEEHGAEKVKEAIVKVSETPFLNGDNERGWKANIDFIMKPDSMAKILEDYYSQNQEKNERPSIPGL